jgi:tRNA pseudouridine32 synthase/23S rRNA pseudouridine746 synthase
VGPIAGIVNVSPVYVKTRSVIEGMSARMHRLDQQQQQTQAAQALQGDHNQVRQLQQQGSGSVSFQEQQKQLLKRRRKCLSHHLLQQIQHSYATSTVAGQPLSLLDVYMSYRNVCDPDVPVTSTGQGFIGMPAGVGDCCAPKLLHAAGLRGLTPVAMCEVWFGSAPGTATKAKQGRAVVGVGVDLNSSRLHCSMYGPCDKCAAILGTMLCGGQP